jgi:hypothetical protein
MRWPGPIPSRAPQRALGGHYGWNIERLFSKVKERLRAAKARTIEALIAAMGEALREVRPDDILGGFRHSGYHPPQSSDTVNKKPL